MTNSNRRQERNPRAGVGILLVCAAILLVRAFGGQASAGTPARARGPAAERKPAAKNRPPLRFTCPDALSDGSLTDPRQGDSLANLAKDLQRPGDENPPGQGRRDVRLFCGPDLDGDGDSEAIVQITWWPMAGSTDESSVTIALLVSKHLTSWRAIASFSLGSDGDQQASGQPVTFVRQSGNKLALRVERSSFTSDAGCKIVGYEIFALRSGVLQRLEVGDSSPPCTPCGCDPPL